MARVYEATQLYDSVSEVLGLIAGHVQRTDSGTEFLACLSCACKLLGSHSIQDQPQLHVNPAISIPTDLAAVLADIPLDEPDTMRAVRASMLRSATCYASCAALVRELLTGEPVHQMSFHN